MKDLIGKRFHCLTVTAFAHVDGRQSPQWVCICDCGKKTMASTGKLTSGDKKSGGHLRDKALKDYRRKWFNKSGVEEEKRVYYGIEMDDALDELEAFT